MPLPHLHILHPALVRNPHLVGWLAEVETAIKSDANWDGCRFHLTECDSQSGFNVPTLNGKVQNALGPIIVIQKVQAALLDRLERMLQRKVVIYPLSPTGPEDIWQACEAARQQFEDGHPQIPVRELLAYLIIRKLERQSMWGGTALNKNFLWQDDLPKGGFPKGYCDAREIIEVADVLCNSRLLSRKESMNSWKYALGDKPTIHRIIELKMFEDLPNLQKYFGKSNRYVPAKLLDYNED